MLSSTHLRVGAAPIGRTFYNSGNSIIIFIYLNNFFCSLLCPVYALAELLAVVFFWEIYILGDKENNPLSLIATDGLE